MEQSTQRPMRELLNTQGSVELTHNENSTLVERKQLDKTPFWLIKEQEKWFAVMGKNRLTPLFETEEEAMKYLDENTWMIIFHVCTIVAEKIITEKLNNHDPLMDEY